MFQELKKRRWKIFIETAQDHALEFIFKLKNHIKESDRTQEISDLHS